jgi:adenylate cyclase
VSNDFRDYRKDLAVLQTSGGGVPSISRNPPSASGGTTNPPWASSGANGGTNMANSVWGSFFNDSDNDDIAQLSHGFSTTGGIAREDAMGFPARDDRRPSVASAMTVSSTGSRSSFSRGFHKKLQNVFGEDFPGDGRQNSDSSLNGRSQVTETQSLHAPRNRGNSLSNTFSGGGGGGGFHSRPTSPTSSRPRTPQPSSEVTPWEFQGPQVSPTFAPHCTQRHQAISSFTSRHVMSLTYLGRTPLGR